MQLRTGDFYSFFGTKKLRAKNITTHERVTYIFLTKTFCYFTRSYLHRYLQEGYGHWGSSIVMGNMVRECLGSEKLLRRAKRSRKKGRSVSDDRVRKAGGGISRVFSCLGSHVSMSMRFLAGQESMYDASFETEEGNKIVASILAKLSFFRRRVGMPFAVLFKKKK